MAPGAIRGSVFELTTTYYEECCLILINVRTGAAAPFFNILQNESCKIHFVK